MFTEYLYELIHFSKRKAVLSIALSVLTGLIQGIGLLLIIPLLNTIGFGAHSTGSDGITKIISSIFNFFGLPLNLYTVIIAYIIIVSFFAYLNKYQTVLNTKIQQGFIKHLKNKLYESLVYAKWQFILNKRSSDLTHAITSDIQLIGAGTHFFIQLVSTLFLMLFHIAAAFILSLPLTLITLAFASIMLMVLKPLNIKAYDTGRLHRLSQKLLYENIMEHLAGMKTAKSYGVEKKHIEKFVSTTSKTEQEVVSFSRARSSTKMYYEIGAVIALSAYIFIALKVISVPGTKLLVLIYIFSRLLPGISSIMQNYQHIKNMLPSFEGVTKLYEQAVSFSQNNQFAYSDPVLSKESGGIIFRDKISFQDVTFRYQESGGENALTDITFDIPFQKITAIIGHSGAGKSTLADLLLGLLEPVSGTITIDGKKYSKEMIQYWRKIIGYVPQETFLFHDTIRENLLWANSDASEQDLMNAIKMAAAYDFVKAFPKGLDTVIGDRGIRLSGGERQRIALARAILRKPRLLILDEATSSLDNKNEEKILEAISSLHGKMTIVIIAHRLSTIRKADRIIVLKNGFAVEKGSRDNLFQIKDGIFHSMVTKAEFF